MFSDERICSGLLRMELSGSAGHTRQLFGQQCEAPPLGFSPEHAFSLFAVWLG